MLKYLVLKALDYLKSRLLTSEAAIGGVRFRVGYIRTFLAIIFGRHGSYQFLRAAGAPVRRRRGAGAPAARKN